MISDEVIRAACFCVLKLGNKWQISDAYYHIDICQKLLAKVLDQKAKLVLIVVPWWPSKAFFAMLQSMIIDCRRIRPSSNMITDLVPGLPHIMVILFHIVHT